MKVESTQGRDDDALTFTDDSFMHELDGPTSRLATALRAANAGWAKDRLSEEAVLAERLFALVRGGRRIRAAASRGMQPIDVHEAIELALQMTWSEVAASACLIRHYTPIPMVHGHVGTLARVIVAALRNAAEAIPRVIPADNHISVETGVDDDGMVTIEVCDTGIGIEAGDLAYVFEPFFTTKGETAAGLGLTAAREAVASMGGHMTVESELGRGTRLRIRLRAAGSMPPTVLPALHARTLPLRRVLVVADESEDRQGLSRSVGDRESEVVHADCEAALERLALGEPFDLVVWDATAWNDGGYRHRLAQVAPDSLWRTFAFEPPPRIVDVDAAAQ